MKVIDLGAALPTLEEIMGLAEKELVVLRKPDGSTFAVSEVGDFDVEVELLKNNSEFGAFMRQLAQENAVMSLQSLRKELAL